MKIKITLDGNTYTSKETDEATKEQIEDTFWPELENLSKFQMHLEDGSLLMLGKDATRRMVMIVED